jgi:ubiquitin C-terminal hydrolase
MFVCMIQECSNCKVNSKVSKKLNIQTPPNVLIIHMKRFDITLSGGEIECVKVLEKYIL